MKQNGSTVALPEFSKGTLQRASSTQQVSWPHFSPESSLFLDGIESQRVRKISGEGLNGFGLFRLPGLAKSVIEMTGFGFFRGLPDASG